MAWLDYFKTVVEQLAMLISGTTEAGAAVPGRETTGQFKVRVDQTTPGTTNAVDVKTTGGGSALDGTNKVPVSLYGKSAAAGDTVLLADATYGLIAAPSGSARSLSDGYGTAVRCPKDVGGGSMDFAVFGYLCNGSTYDRARNNVATTAVLASAARTSSTASAVQANYNGRGVVVFVNVTAVVDTPSIVVTVQAQDPGGSGYWDMLSSAAITAAGLTALVVYPGCVAVANQVANLPLPRAWRVSVVHGDTDSITYGIGAVTIN